MFHVQPKGRAGGILDRIQSSATFEATHLDAVDQVSPHTSRQDSNVEIVWLRSLDDSLSW